MQMEDSTIGWRFINPQMKALYGVHSMPETAENVADELPSPVPIRSTFALRSQLVPPRRKRRGVSPIG